MKKEKSAYIIKLGADGFLATITPLPVALVLGFFFFNARGLFGGSSASGGIFGSSETTNVCDALVVAGPEALCS
jgi:hypothetical protein